MDLNKIVSFPFPLLFSPLLSLSILLLFQIIEDNASPKCGGEPIKCLVLFLLSIVVFPNSLGF